MEGRIINDDKVNLVDGVRNLTIIAIVKSAPSIQRTVEVLRWLTFIIFFSHLCFVK